jgi:PadR family transcriptional regulator, regulatory protein PadR
MKPWPRVWNACYPTFSLTIWESPVNILPERLGMKKQVDLVQGTLDMLILKAVSLGGLHGYGVLVRLQQLTGGQLQIQQGSLYPALYRLEHQDLISSEWGESENKRKAKFYKLTAAGRKQLKAEADSWNRFSLVVATVLGAVPEES